MCSIEKGNCDVLVSRYTINPCCFGGKGFVTDPKEVINAFVLVNVCFVDGSVRINVKVLTDVL